MSWIKSNPLAVICIVIIVLALVSFYYPTHVWSSAFRAEMAARDAQLQRVRSLQNTGVVVPAPTPDQPPLNLNIVVNQAAINRLEMIYKDMEKEYLGIYTAAQQRNAGVVQRYGFIMPGLFPFAADQNTLFRSRTAYIKAFQELYQTLGAGAPPDPVEIARLIEREAIAYRRSLLLPTSASLSAEQGATLTQRQAEKLEEMYRTRAAELHVYAPPLQVDATGRTWGSPGPFQIGEWARPQGRPEPFDIWEGQMQLWVQQDLAEAIIMANDIRNDPDGSLLDKPVKRIVAMAVTPGYIGVPPTGYGWSGALTNEVVAARYTEIKTQLTQKIPTNYTVSPTGRASNPLYDVRHATLSVVVDSQKLPVLINALGKVNFMTVLGMTVRDVDEYAALREGYYYGPCDAVQVDLKVESLWLREWTAPFMPNDVRYHLGIPPRIHPQHLPSYDRYEPLVIRQMREKAANPTTGLPGSIPGAIPGAVPGSRPGAPGTFY